MYRKLRKLVRNPKQFYQDSIFFIGNKKVVDSRLLELHRCENLMVLIGFSEWKKTFYNLLFSESALYFIKNDDSNSLISILKARKKPRVLIWGYSEEPELSVILKKQKIRVERVEDGFVRSVGLGAQHVLPLSYVIDKTGTLYFDSRKKSGLERICEDIKLNDSQLKVSRELIDIIVESKISKYNDLSENKNKVVLDLNCRNILCIGQVEGDASIKYGSPNIKTNLEFVECVRNKYPEAEIFFRPHPDTLIGGRAGSEKLEHISEYAKVLPTEFSISSLLDVFPEVHTITSLVGFEALLRGKNVFVYGQPFYSGWGLTVDECKLERRNRKLTIEELFYATYIKYPNYVKADGIQTDLAGTLKFLEDSKVDGERILRRVQKERSTHIRKNAWAFRFGNKITRMAVANMFPEYNIRFADVSSKDKKLSNSAKQEILDDIKVNGDVDFLVWGYMDPEGVSRFANSIGAHLYRVEDSFIRSVGLGGDLSISGQALFPMSVVKDSLSLYYNYRDVSDVELLIRDYEMSDDDIIVAKKAIKRIIDLDITKYNVTVSSGFSYPNDGMDKVLVLGQVESDASIKYGTDEPILMNDLVRIAVKENPNAHVYYKPHPAVLSGHKLNKSDPVDVSHICTVLPSDITLPESLRGVSRVYVISSGAGFEALFRGIPVTCFGANFYAGWGLTDDRIEIPRRGQHKTIEELFYCFYILYTRYFDHETRSLIDLNKAIDLISEGRKAEKGIELLRKARKAKDAENLLSASSLYEEVLKFQSGFQLNKELAEIYLGLKNYKKAAEYLQICRGIYPIDTNVSVEIAFLNAFYLDQLEEAYYLVLSIMKERPELIDNIKVIRVLVNAYVKKGLGDPYVLLKYKNKIKGKTTVPRMDQMLLNDISQVN